MKWKKTSGTWRTYQGKEQGRITEDEGMFFASWLDARGAWSEAIGFEALEKAKAWIEARAELAECMAGSEALELCERRRVAKVWDDMPDEDKKIFRAFLMYKKMSPVERDYVRKNSDPVLCDVFDKEIAREESEKSKQVL